MDQQDGQLAAQLAEVRRKLRQKERKLQKYDKVLEAKRHVQETLHRHNGPGNVHGGPGSERPSKKENPPQDLKCSLARSVTFSMDSPEVIFVTPTPHLASKRKSKGHKYCRSSSPRHEGRSHMDVVTVGIDDEGDAVDGRAHTDKLVMGSSEMCKKMKLIGDGDFKSRKNHMDNLVRSETNQLKHDAGGSSSSEDGHCVSKDRRGQTVVKDFNSNHMGSLATSTSTSSSLELSPNVTRPTGVYKDFNASQESNSVSILQELSLIPEIRQNNPLRNNAVTLETIKECPERNIGHSKYNCKKGQTASPAQIQGHTPTTGISSGCGVDIDSSNVNIVNSCDILCSVDAGSPKPISKSYPQYRGKKRLLGSTQVSLTKGNDDILHSPKDIQMKLQPSAVFSKTIQGSSVQQEFTTEASHNSNLAVFKLPETSRREADHGKETPSEKKGAPSVQFPGVEESQDIFCSPPYRETIIRRSCVSERKRWQKRNSASSSSGGSGAGTPDIEKKVEEEACVSRIRKNKLSRKKNYQLSRQKESSLSNDEEKINWLSKTKTNDWFSEANEEPLSGKISQFCTPIDQLSREQHQNFKQANPVCGEIELKCGEVIKSHRHSDKQEKSSSERHKEKLSKKDKQRQEKLDNVILDFCKDTGKNSRSNSVGCKVLKSLNEDGILSSHVQNMVVGECVEEPPIPVHNHKVKNPEDNAQKDLYSDVDQDLFSESIVQCQPKEVSNMSAKQLSVECVKVSRKEANVNAKAASDVCCSEDDELTGRYTKVLIPSTVQRRPENHSTCEGRDSGIHVLKSSKEGKVDVESEEEEKKWVDSQSSNRREDLKERGASITDTSAGRSRRESDDTEHTLASSRNTTNTSESLDVTVICKNRSKSQEDTISKHVTDAALYHEGISNTSFDSQQVRGIGSASKEGLGNDVRCEALFGPEENGKILVAALAGTTSGDQESLCVLLVQEKGLALCSQAGRGVGREEDRCGRGEAATTGVWKVAAEKPYHIALHTEVRSVVAVDLPVEDDVRFIVILSSSRETQLKLIYVQYNLKEKDWLVTEGQLESLLSYAPKTLSGCAVGEWSIALSCAPPTAHCGGGALVLVDLDVTYSRRGRCWQLQCHPHLRALPTAASSVHLLKLHQSSCMDILVFKTESLMIFYDVQEDVVIQQVSWASSIPFWVSRVEDLLFVLSIEEASSELNLTALNPITGQQEKFFTSDATHKHSAAKSESPLPCCSVSPPVGVFLGMSEVIIVFREGSVLHAALAQTAGGKSTER